jgi:DNA-binding transcriptional ArsR family regulator
MAKAQMDMATFAIKAAAVAELLKTLGNQRRLMVLCTLAELGQANVGDLAQRLRLSQSATSQHLARMRDDGLVTFERESQTLWYRIADPRVERLLSTLYDLYCADISEG